MDDNTIWFFGSYAAGTLIGMIIGYVTGARTAVELTVDQLVQNGFLRHRKNKDGDVEILKLNQKD